MMHMDQNSRERFWNNMAWENTEWRNNRHKGLVPHHGYYADLGLTIEKEIENCI